MFVKYHLYIHELASILTYSLIYSYYQLYNTTIYSQEAIFHESL